MPAAIGAHPWVRRDLRVKAALIQVTAEKHLRQRDMTVFVSVSVCVCVCPGYESRYLFTAGASEVVDGTPDLPIDQHP